MRAASASNEASQPYSRAYSSALAWITQPRSPGAPSSRTSVATDHRLPTTDTTVSVRHNCSNEFRPVPAPNRVDRGGVRVRARQRPGRRLAAADRRGDRVEYRGAALPVLLARRTCGRAARTGARRPTGAARDG